MADAYEQAWGPVLKAAAAQHALTSGEPTKNILMPPPSGELEEAPDEVTERLPSDEKSVIPDHAYHGSWDNVPFLPSFSPQNARRLGLGAEYTLPGRLKAIELDDNRTLSLVCTDLLPHKIHDRDNPHARFGIFKRVHKVGPQLADDWQLVTQVSTGRALNTESWIKSSGGLTRSRTHTAWEGPLSSAPLVGETSFEQSSGSQRLVEIIRPTILAFVKMVAIEPSSTSRRTLRPYDIATDDTIPEDSKRLITDYIMETNPRDWSVLFRAATLMIERSPTNSLAPADSTDIYQDVRRAMIISHNNAMMDQWGVPDTEDQWQIQAVDNIEQQVIPRYLDTLSPGNLVKYAQTAQQASTFYRGLPDDTQLLLWARGDNYLFFRGEEQDEPIELGKPRVITREDYPLYELPNNNTPADIRATIAGSGTFAGEVGRYVVNSGMSGIDEFMILDLNETHHAVTKAIDKEFQPLKGGFPGMSRFILGTLFQPDTFRPHVGVVVTEKDNHVLHEEIAGEDEGVVAARRHNGKLVVKMAQVIPHYSRPRPFAKPVVTHYGTVVSKPLAPNDERITSMYLHDRNLYQKTEDHTSIIKRITSPQNVDGLLRAKGV